MATIIPFAFSWLQSELKSKESEPLDIQVKYGGNDPHCAGSWLFAATPKDLPKLPKSTLIDAYWAHKQGGIDREETDLVLTVQGKHSDAVNLSRIRIVDLRTRPAPKGIAAGTSGCGGETPERVFNVALGDREPKVLEWDKKASSLKKSDEISLFVTDSQTEKFIVRASPYPSTAQKDLCECVISWRLAIDWVYHDKSDTLILDDHGKPFETVQGGPEQTYIYDESTGNWNYLPAS
ncbi:hypothetical protein ACWEBX_37060 [Streptomyces sp. NPDC005070]